MDTFLSIISLSTGDWISLASIAVDVIAMAVGGFLAIWVVQSIQSKLDTEQKLRDYFCSELLSLRNGYRNVMQEVYCHRVKAKDFKKRMSTLNKLSTDLMTRLNTKYGIDSQPLNRYQLDLNSMVTETQAYTNAFHCNRSFQLSDDLELDLREFEATEGSEVFNDILMGIYS